MRFERLFLASALQVQRALARTGAARLLFLSADERLLAAAQDEGALQDNPNHHP